MNQENINTQNNIVSQNTEEVLEKENTKEMDSISTLFKKSFDLYEKRFWKLAGVILVSALMVILVITLSGVLFGVGIVTLGKFPVILIVILLVFIISMVSAWSNAALLIAIRDSEEKIGIKESFKRSRKYIWNYFIVNAIVSFSILAGFAAFIIPAIILGVMFSFSLFVLVCEGDKELDAIVKSREYVRGLWWRVLGRLIIVGLLVLLVSMIPSVGHIVGTFFGVPFMMVYIYLMYKNIKEVKGEVQTNDRKRTKNVITLLLVLGVLLPMFLFSLINKIGDKYDLHKVWESYQEKVDYDDLD